MVGLNHFHVVSAPVPKTIPPSSIPRADSRPSITGRHALDPNQNCTKRKVRIGDIVTHCHDPVPTKAVLVHDRRKKVELLFDRHPCLFPLWPNERLWADWEHDGKKRPEEDLLGEADE